jgi:hypothetical protein
MEACLSTTLHGIISAKPAVCPIVHMRISNIVMLYQHYREAERENVRKSSLPVKLKN